MGVVATIDTTTLKFVETFQGSDSYRSFRLAQFAEKALDLVQENNARITGKKNNKYKTWVDGRPEAPLRTVKPDGTIIFEFQILDEIFEWIGNELVRNSPIKSGRYSESHVFLAENTQVLPGEPIPPNSDWFVFVNTQPYARKIERGLSWQAPDGVYQGVAGVAARRFRNLADIYFGYRSLLFGGIDSWASTTRMPSPSRRGKNRAEWLRRQPAIIIIPE
jgi:hypothetical protein